jgi:drug/metabolite transporter (DMT)-like permease
LLDRLKNHDSHALRIFAAFAAVYIIWGSTYLAIRVAIETIPPFVMAGIRFTIAGTLLYTWMRFRGAAAPTFRQWRSAAIVGVAMLVIGNGGLAWAEGRVPSGVASLLIAITPMWIVGIEIVWHRVAAPGWRAVAGIVIGIAGVIVLVGPGEILGHGNLNAGGVAMLMVGSFAWAAGSLYSRKAHLPSSQILGASMEMLFAGVGLLVGSAICGEWSGFDPAAISVRSWLAVAYLVVFGSIVGFTAYVWLMKVEKPSRVATYAFVNPVIAVLLGWGFAGEELSRNMFVAGGVIVLAVVLIVTSQSKVRPVAGETGDAHLYRADNA